MPYEHSVDVCTAAASAWQAHSLHVLLAWAWVMPCQYAVWERASRVGLAPACTRCTSGKMTSAVTSALRVVQSHAPPSPCHVTSKAPDYWYY